MKFNWVSKVIRHLQLLRFRFWFYYSLRLASGAVQMVSDWFGLVLRHSIENCSKKISFQYHKWYRGIPSYQTLHFSNLPITQTKSHFPIFSHTLFCSNFTPDFSTTQFFYPIFLTNFLFPFEVPKIKIHCTVTGTLMTDCPTIFYLSSFFADSAISK